MRISDWRSDVCSSDLPGPGLRAAAVVHDGGQSADRRDPPGAERLGRVRDGGLDLPRPVDAGLEPAVVRAAGPAIAGGGLLAPLNRYRWLRGASRGQMQGLRHAATSPAAVVPTQTTSTPSRQPTLGLAAHTLAPTHSPNSE